MTNEIASNQQEAAQEIKEIKKQMKEEIDGVKTLVVSESRNCNETTLEDVVNMVKVIAVNQQENAKEIRDLKRLLVSGSVKTNETSLDTVVKEIKDDVKEVKRLLTSNQTDCDYVTPQSTNVTSQTTNATMEPTSPLDNVTAKPSKEALVSALVCELLYLAALPM